VFSFEAIILTLYFTWCQVEMTHKSAEIRKAQLNMSNEQEKSSSELGVTVIPALSTQLLWGVNVVEVVGAKM